MDTIAAATLNGAKVLRVDEITGSLEAGKRAYKKNYITVKD